MSLKRPLRGVSVLVVDDDPDCRDVLRQMVEWFGARVHTAQDGPDALAWLATHTPDLLLLDLRMPGMDGFRVFERLRAEPRFSKLRAVAVTALGSDPDVMRTWEAGFDGHLVKPIDIETLAAALNRAFWAHSGQVRFSVWHAPTTATRSRRPRTVKSSPSRVVEMATRRDAPPRTAGTATGDAEVRPADVARVEGPPDAVAPPSGQPSRRAPTRARSGTAVRSGRRSSRAS